MDGKNLKAMFWAKALGCAAFIIRQLKLTASS